MLTEHKHLDTGKQKVAKAKKSLNKLKQSKIKNSKTEKFVKVAEVTLSEIEKAKRRKNRVRLAFLKAFLIATGLSAIASLPLRFNISRAERVTARNERANREAREINNQIGAHINSINSIMAQRGHGRANANERYASSSDIGRHGLGAFATEEDVQMARAREERAAHARQERERAAAQARNASKETANDIKGVINNVKEAIRELDLDDKGKGSSYHPIEPDKRTAGLDFDYCPRRLIKRTKYV